MKLSINVDHIATLREQRKEGVPNLIDAAKIALNAGADGITFHLREDRRHIQDNDAFELRRITSRLNMEMAATSEMVHIATQVKPDFCCLVPESREELTTEGGIDVIYHHDHLKSIIAQLKSTGIKVSLFVDPSTEQITAAQHAGCDFIELHTGPYANSKEPQREQELFKLIKSATHGHQCGLGVNAGHGLTHLNISDIVKIPLIEEVSIGHSIVSRSLFLGLENAVKEMKHLIYSS